MLPAHPSRRHRIFRRLDLFNVAREQRRSYVLGIDGLGEIIYRAELHRIHRTRYVAVTGEDDGAGFRSTLFDGRYYVKAATAAAKAHLHDGESRRGFLHLQQPVADRFRCRHREAPAFHGEGEALQERLIILDDQKRSLARKRADCSIGHDISKPYNYLPESDYGS